MDQGYFAPSGQQEVQGLPVDVAHDDQPAPLPQRSGRVLKLEPLDHHAKRRGLPRTDQPDRRTTIFRICDTHMHIMSSPHVCAPRKRGPADVYVQIFVIIGAQCCRRFPAGRKRATPFPSSTKSSRSGSTLASEQRTAGDNYRDTKPPGESFSPRFWRRGKKPEDHGSMELLGHLYCGGIFLPLQLHELVLKWCHGLGDHRSALLGAELFHDLQVYGVALVLSTRRRR